MPQNSCKLYSECRRSVDCAKYKEEIIKEEKKNRRKKKSKINQNVQAGLGKGDTIKVFDNGNEILLTLTI